MISTFTPADLRFGNLYSFFLSEDMLIPYNKWTYEEEFEFCNKIFTWDKKTKIGSVKRVNEKKRGIDWSDTDKAIDKLL